MNDSLIYRVRYFAQEYEKTKRGIYKGQTNPDVIRRQCFHGKMAEWAVWYYLRSIGQTPIHPPEMRILARPNWDADLETSEYKIAVKCAMPWNLKNAHGYTWTFQAGNKRRDTVLNNRSPMYAVFFVQCLSDYKYEIYGTSTMARLYEAGAFIFEDGVDLARLKGEKLFVKAHKTSAIKVIKKIANFERLQNETH